MTDPSPSELGRRLDDTIRQFGLDMTRTEKRLGDVESEVRSGSAQADGKYVSQGLYSRDHAEIRTDIAEIRADFKDLKATLDNNRRLVLTSLVLPVVVALIVFFLTTQAGR